jgi:hypothetical protein
MHIKFWSENMNERYHLGDLGVYGWIILNVYIKETGCGVEDLIHLARNRDQLWAVINTAADIWLCE